MHLTKDNIIVVNHDHDFFGLNIETSNYAGLLQKQHTNGESLPTLTDFFSIGLNQSKTKLLLEIKTSKTGGLKRTRLLVDCLVNMLPPNAHPYNLEFILFNFDASLYIKKKLPDFLVHYLNGDKNAAEIKNAGLNGIDYHFEVLLQNPLSIKQFKDVGLQTNSWTVNDLNTAKKLISQQINFITTDYPLLFLQNGL